MSPQPDQAAETTFPVVTIDPALALRLQTAGRRSRDLAEESTKADAERDALIRQARAEGGSLREIGELAGISHTQVKNIAHGRADRRTNHTKD
jgi:DNA-directed RNA polymerase specialized sigma24 family protein